MIRNFNIIWIVIIVVGIIIVGNQSWQLYFLHQKAKEECVNANRNIIEDAVVELSMCAKKEGSAVGYDADEYVITYFFNGVRVDKHVAEDVTSQWISSRPMYDVRDTSQWTLGRLNERIQKRVAAMNHKTNLPLELTVRDSLGNRVACFREGELKGSSPCFFSIRLGFLSKDTLDVTCDFTLDDFWEKVQGQVTLIVALFLLLVFCVITLVQMLRREKKAAAFRKLFVQAFVHDLKLPVSNALKCEYLLEKNMASGATPDNKMRLVNIVDQLNRVQGTIGMLLTTVTDEHGVAIQPGEVDIHKLLGYLVESGRWHVTAGRIFNILTDLQAKNSCIEGDEAMLEAVFQNLIENALKYSEGHVDISISSREVNKESMQIIVADNGLGIPRKALKKIFKSRYRVPEHRERAKGTGIGLSVTKSIVEAHGGTIGVESVEGHGSRFIITLPYQISKGWKIKLMCYMQRMIRKQRD